MQIKNGVLVDVEEKDLDRRGCFVVPNEVFEIGSRAFKNCSKKIKYIKLSQNVVEIKPKAFYQLPYLSEVEMSKNLISIGSNAFFECLSLHRLDFSEGLKYIGDEAFYGCKNLTFVGVPNSVEKIGERAFACSGISSFDIPLNVDVVESSLFNCCQNLTSVGLHSGVKEVRDSAFFDCNNLYVNIGPGISVDRSAFYGTIYDDSNLYKDSVF